MIRSLRPGPFDRPERPEPFDDRGSTLPLILGFVVVALLAVAGAVAAGQAFVQQRDLQSVCDGASVAAAASAGDLDRNTPLGSGDALPFTDVQATVERYLARDPARRAIHITSVLSADARTLTLTCTETRPIAFGAVFGRASGVRHTATSSARAPLTG